MLRASRALVQSFASGGTCCTSNCNPNPLAFSYSTLAGAVSSCMPPSSARPASEQNQDYIDFPGGRIPYTSSLSFVGGPDRDQQPKIPGYRTIDMLGRDVAGCQMPHPIDKEMGLRMYQCMATLQVRAPNPCQIPCGWDTWCLLGSGHA